MWDTKEMIEKPSELYRGLRTMLSGSYREGFRFTSSDRDFMRWFPNYKVKCLSPSLIIYPDIHLSIWRPVILPRDSPDYSYSHRQIAELSDPHWWRETILNIFLVHYSGWLIIS
jgi:hypothetical protein